jgi:hypothetical protein
MSTAEGRITEVEAEKAALRAANAALRAQVQALLGRIEEVKSRLAKDSHNSSKPPVVFSYLITSSSRHRVPRVLRGRLREMRRLLEPSVVARDEMIHGSPPRRRPHNPAGPLAAIP